MEKRFLLALLIACALPSMLHAMNKEAAPQQAADSANDDSLVFQGVRPHAVYVIRRWTPVSHFLLEAKTLTKPIGKATMLERLHGEYKNLDEIRLLYLIPQPDGKTTDLWKTIFIKESDNK